MACRAAAPDMSVAGSHGDRPPDGVLRRGAWVGAPIEQKRSRVHVQLFEFGRNREGVSWFLPKNALLGELRLGTASGIFTRDVPPSLNCANMYRHCIATGDAVKTPAIPSLRVDPALRRAAEEVLHDGKSLSGFAESALRAHIQPRQQQAAFVARGLASREQAKASDGYFSSAAVLKKLEARLAKAKKASI